MRAPQEILKQTNELAALFYKLLGYNSPDGFRFYLSKHGHEQAVWRQACIAQEELTGTDIINVLEECEESTNEQNNKVENL